MFLLLVNLLSVLNVYTVQNYKSLEIFEFLKPVFYPFVIQVFRKLSIAIKDLVAPMNEWLRPLIISALNGLSSQRCGFETLLGHM